VVGYNAIAVSLKPKVDNDFQLTESEKESLLKIARNTLETFIKDGNIPKIDSSQLDEN